MDKTSWIHIGILSLGLMAISAPARATSEFDACVRKLCVDTEQGDCWIKGGAQLCNKNQKSCRELEDHTYPKIIRKVGKIWEVETKSGRGFVNERWMMVSGDKC
jgi:hypothetical protein